MMNKRHWMKNYVAFVYRWQSFWHPASSDEIRHTPSERGRPQQGWRTAWNRLFNPNGRNWGQKMRHAPKRWRERWRRLWRHRRTPASPVGSAWRVLGNGCHGNWRCPWRRRRRRQQRRPGCGRQEKKKDTNGVLSPPGKFYSFFAATVYIGWGTMTTESC